MLSVQGSLLKEVLSRIKKLVDVGNLSCTSAGFAMTEYDRTRLVVVSLLLAKEDFESYSCERDFSMGINPRELVRMLKCAAADDDILQFMESDGHSVKFVCESPIRYTTTTELTMDFIDVNEHPSEVPTIYPCAVIMMPSSEFARICKNLLTIDKTVVISVKANDGIMFTSEGESGSVNMFCHTNISNKTEEAVSIQMSLPVAMRFNLESLNSVAAAAAPMSGQVTILLTENMSSCLEYEISEVSHVKFYLRPV